MSSYTNSFVLPDLKKVCPWKALVNPNFDKAFAESSTWVDSFGILSDAKRQHFIHSATELLASYAYPYADVEELRVCCDAMGLFFTIDEILDVQEYPGVCTMANIYIKVMEDDLNEDSDIVHMVVDFKERLHRMNKPRSERRFIKTFCEYIESVVHEKKHIEPHGINLQDFEAHRRNNSGVTSSFALIEYARDIELPDAVFQDETFMKIYWAAADMIGYSNDLYSYSRERDIGLHENNIITILMREKNLTLQQAANHVGELFRELMKYLQDNKSLLPSFAAFARNQDGSVHDIDENVAIYVRSLEEWVVGNVYWSFATQRYFGAEHKEVEQTLVVRLKQPL